MFGTYILHILDIFYFSYLYVIMHWVFLDIEFRVNFARDILTHVTRMLYIYAYNIITGTTEACGCVKVRVILLL